MTAIISLLIIITLSVLTTRIGTLALVYTGLSKETAKFQARSAFMGVGFTTQESELVVNNPVRRKILTILIFLGNAGIITTISSVIFSFLSLERSETFSAEIVVLISGLIILWSLSQSHWIDKKLSRVIDWALSRYTNLDVRDYYSLLHLSKEYRVSEIKVEENGWLKSKTLAEANLDAEGISVLGIKRPTGKYIGAPEGKTTIKKDDILIIYGRYNLINSLEKRKEGGEGDSAHKDAVNEQRKMKNSQSVQS